MYWFVFLFILMYFKSSCYFMKPMKTILISQNEEKHNNWRKQDHPIVKKDELNLVFKQGNKGKSI